jgi:hypothetical protein
VKTFEWLLDHFGNVAVKLLRSAAWWRRALGLLLVVPVLWMLVILVFVWIVFGKKPHDDTDEAQA